MTPRAVIARTCAVSAVLLALGLAGAVAVGAQPTPTPTVPLPARDPVSFPGGLRPNAAPLASGTGVHIVKSVSGPSCTGYSSQNTPPATIRVLVHNSKGTPTGVVTVPFQRYVQNVLPNEWISSWKPEALKAGAVAAKSYGWFWVNHYGGYFNTPSTCFDVTDDTAFQVYFPSSSQPSTDAAVQATWPVIARKNGQVVQTFYRAYLTSSSEKCGAAANGTTMSQYGSQACALAGKSYTSILHTYYGSDLELANASTGGGGGGGGTGPVGQISSPLGCVDLSNGTLAKGTPIFASNCNAGASEQFALGAGNSVRPNDSASNWCLDAKGAGTTAGTVLQLYTCNGSGAQQWVWRGDNTLFNANSGLCVAVSGTGRLQLEPCSKSTDSQYWDLSQLQSRRGPVSAGVAAPGSICLDDRFAVTSNRNPIQIFPCNGTAAQVVTVNLPILRIFGQCIDVAGGHTTSGTKVALFRCNATGAQSWSARSDGSLRNTKSGKCLDVPGGTTNASTQLQIWTCNGTAAQRFTLPS